MGAGAGPGTLAGEMSAPPVRFTEERRAAYLVLLRDGYGRHEAARRLEVDPATVVRYRAADAAFDMEVVRAEEEAAEPVVRKLYEAALDGQPWAVKLWTSRRAMGRAGGASWAEGPQRIEVDVSGRVEHVAELGPAAARVAELRARLAERQEALALGGGPVVVDAESWEADRGGEDPREDPLGAGTAEGPAGSA